MIRTLSEIHTPVALRRAQRKEMHMEISVVLALISMAMSLPIILTHHAPQRRPYNEGPVRCPLTPERRERCRCGQCEQCDPLYQSYGR